MNEREQIILGFGDAEILRWWQTFGTCPHWRHTGRLQSLLADASAVNADERYALANLLGRRPKTKGADAA